MLCSTARWKLRQIISLKANTGRMRNTMLVTATCLAASLLAPPARTSVLETLTHMKELRGKSHARDSHPTWRGVSLVLRPFRALHGCLHCGHKFTEGSPNADVQRDSVRHRPWAGRSGGIPPVGERRCPGFINPKSMVFRPPIHL